MHQFNNLHHDANENKKADIVKLSDILSESQLNNEYIKHNIRREFVELFNEFSLNLIYLAHKTYLGREYIRTNKEIVGHFDWCYNTICENYLKLGIDFSTKKNPELNFYFFKHLMNYIYENRDYREDMYEADVEHFNYLMNYSLPKDYQNFVLMVELYYLFAKTF